MTGHILKYEAKQEYLFSTSALGSSSLLAVVGEHYISGIKRSEREADRSLPSKVEVKKE